MTSQHFSFTYHVLSKAKERPIKACDLKQKAALLENLGGGSHQTNRCITFEKKLQTLPKHERYTSFIPVNVLVSHSDMANDGLMNLRQNISAPCSWTQHSYRSRMGGDP